MDKLRIVLEYVQKYHFWLLCLVAVAAGLFGWMKARGTLSAEFQKNKGAITGKFGALDQIRGNEFPPNDTWQQEIAALTEKERQLVENAWKTVYAEQQKVLEWPEVLGEPFKNEVMRWVDAYVTQKRQDAEITQVSRVNYRNRVANVEFRKLLEIIDARPGDDGTKTGAAPAAGDKPDRPYKVVWSPDSQAKVNKGMEMVGEPMVQGAGPKESFDVWLKLEDLWVYRALLKIIAATNADAGFISRVKQIDALAIGVNAAQEFQKGMASGGHITYAEAAAAPTEQPAARPEPGADNVEKPIDDGRYVDANGNPLPGGAAHNEQFKRMPIYMRLMMDQREITRLLTACANSPLPVEVRQLRINPESKDAAQKRPGPAAEGAPAPTTLGAYDVLVEIHGLIYIYNPPDPAKLGQPGAAGVGM